MNLKINKINILPLILLISALSIAQPVDPPADDDPLPSPINTKLVWLGLAALPLGYYLIKRKSSKI